MRALFLLTFFLLAGTISYSQPITQQVVSTGGGSVLKEELILDWTLGETVIATFSTGSIILTQGFHQPDLVVTVIRTADGLPFTIEAYPNPTHDLLIISIDNATAGNFQYLLYDRTGKVLEQMQFESDNQAVSMISYPAGIYLLKVTQSDSEIKTFEIIKH